MSQRDSSSRAKIVLVHKMVLQQQSMGFSWPYGYQVADTNRKYPPVLNCPIRAKFARPRTNM